MCNRAKTFGTWETSTQLSMTTLTERLTARVNWLGYFQQEIHQQRLDQMHDFTLLSTPKRRHHTERRSMGNQTCPGNIPVPPYSLVLQEQHNPLLTRQQLHDKSRIKETNWKVLWIATFPWWGIQRTLHNIKKWQTYFDGDTVDAGGILVVV